MNNNFYTIIFFLICYTILFYLFPNFSTKIRMGETLIFIYCYVSTKNASIKMIKYTEIPRKIDKNILKIPRGSSSSLDCHKYSENHSAIALYHSVIDL